MGGPVEHKLLRAIANYGSEVSARNLNNPLGKFLYRRVAALYEKLDAE